MYAQREPVGIVPFIAPRGEPDLEVDQIGLECAYVVVTS
jgi:hypothetical protein